MYRDRLIQVRVNINELNQIRQNVATSGFHHLSDYVRDVAINGGNTNAQKPDYVTWLQKQKNC